MLHALKLLLPALVPSWRFFDIIAPSPRVQFALLGAVDDKPQDWHEYRPRPVQLSFLHMLGRMLWNPQWNESMFVISCAERLMESPTRHSEDEIMKRIISDVSSDIAQIHRSEATHLQFRLLIVERQGDKLHEQITYYSRVEHLTDQAVV